MLMPLVLGKARKDWEAYSVSHAGWLDQSDILAVETNQWLQDFDFFHPPGSPTRKEDFDILRDVPPDRKLSTGRQTATTLVIIENTTNTDGSSSNSNIDDQSTDTSIFEISTTPKIPQEIFIKGEDLPGGIDGDLTTVSESWRVRYAPVWQVSPPPKRPAIINYNFLGDATSGGTFNAIMVSKKKSVIDRRIGYRCAMGQFLC